MARLGSRQIAGYYPTPTRLLSSFASILRWPEASFRGLLLDPCAGDGEAIATLRDLWREEIDSTSKKGTVTHRELRVIACEMERHRAEDLHRRLKTGADQAHHGDAFHLDFAPSENDGAAVLYLNPPYDTDPDHGRLEQRFLERFAPALYPGAGILFLLVPYRSLRASASYLVEHFMDLRAWRLPEPEFDSFGQVLVVGRRSQRPLRNDLLVARICSWAEDPTLMPVLPERCQSPIEMQPEWFHLAVDLESYDSRVIASALRPPTPSKRSEDWCCRDLLGTTFSPAVPPKPAHIALALSAGLFNGYRLEPDDPIRHPPLLAKGTFERAYEQVSEKTNSRGEVTCSIEIEKPKLCLTVLSLHDYTFHTLEPGTVPTGSDAIEEWNAADLIAHYRHSLADMLTRQFPPLHDPRIANQQIHLPQLARTPYHCQEQAIQAALKLLAEGKTPFFVAEVGVGKSTIALITMAALSPEYHSRTVAQLRHLGHTQRPPCVRRTLIVCPPHLLKSWRDQAAAVVPETRVQIVHSAADLETDAQIFVLSRETAKLGHGYAGVEGQCPGCGAVLETTAKQNASRRLRCTAAPRRPLNMEANLAETLAAHLATVAPEDSLVQSTVRGRVLRRLLDREPVKLEPARFRPFLRGVESQIEAEFLFGLETGLRYSDRLWVLLKVAQHLAQGLDECNSVATRLEDWVHRQEDHQDGSLRSSILHQAESLRQLGGLRGFGHDSLRLLLKALEELHGRGEWECTPCDEALFQSIPKPRRLPLARLIQRRFRNHFDLLILDEAHEYNRTSSAQTKAVHRLISLPGISTLVLTGSLMGGYASSLFPSFWALSPDFREEFDRTQRPDFVARYGYRKTMVKAKTVAVPASERGAHTDREVGKRTVLGEAPGIHPAFVLDHLLPTAVLVHKADLDTELPALTELPAPVEITAEEPQATELLAEYQRLQRALLARIREDRYEPERAGRLLGALVELPSYLDRATDDQPPFEIRYPEALGGASIARGLQFPSSWTTPKESWLLEQLREALGKGERVIVFLRHTGSRHLPHRLTKLIGALTPKVAWLDSKKVPTAKRESWIDSNVIAAQVKVLLVNPNAVRTGLNNLVAFSTAIWYELDYSATTCRQANGRLHRIGQTRPVTIWTPYYRETAQQVAFDLVAKKITASLQVDGLDLQGALEAAGASAESTASVATAMSLGQAVYEALTGRRDAAA